MTAPAVLRDMIVALVVATGHKALAEAVQLCASEVVTNAHRHTAVPRIHVDVTVHERSVTVWVHDDRPRNLPVVPERSDCEGGLGLFMVDQLADTWGTSLYGGSVPTSKAVWFRLDKDGRAVS